jgi:hypothetical protein
MRQPIEIEDIESLRLGQGIDDVELREEVRGLRIGDLVRLTLLAGEGVPVSETIVVRITYARDRSFRGELTKRPTSSRFAGLRAGSSLAFAAVHIHSIPRKGGAPRDAEDLRG